jgi:two-component system, cell cycle response regulator
LDVTASVGVTALEFDDDAPELMLKRADQALYCAKRDGRNRVVADAA